MCQECWDADKKVATECDHREWPVFGLSELKKSIEQKWKETKKTSFHIYSDAIVEKPKGSLDWGFGAITLHVDFLS